MTVSELQAILSKLPPHAFIVDKNLVRSTLDLVRIYEERNLVDVREVQTIDGAHGVKLIFGEPAQNTR